MSKALMDLSDPDVVRSAGQLFQEWTLNPASAPRDSNGNLDPVAVKQALEAIGLPFKSTVERVHLQYDTPEDIYLSLPHAESLQERLTKNLNGDDYQLPEFFKKMADGSSNAAELKIFYEYRVGDYVLQRCR